MIDWGKILTCLDKLYINKGYVLDDYRSLSSDNNILSLYARASNVNRPDEEDWVRWEYNHIPHASFRYLTCGFTVDVNDERREFFRIPYSHDDLTEEQKSMLKERIEMPPKIDPLQVITLERTPDAIWQAFLLHITYMFTGYRWHGGYVHKELVFSKNGVLAIKPEILPILTIDDKAFIPEIVFDEDNQEKGYIKCYWWSEWGGLYNVTANFLYSDITNRIKFKEILSSNIVKYQCNVMY